MFSDEELNDILRLLAAVLHLGNLKFQGKNKRFDLIGEKNMISFSDNNSKYGYMCSREYKCTSSYIKIT
jgi:hypothetical protein